MNLSPAIGFVGEGGKKGGIYADSMPYLAEETGPPTAWFKSKPILTVQAFSGLQALVFFLLA